MLAGLDMKIVHETLGHSSISITSDTYTLVFRPLLKAAMEAMTAMIHRARTGTEASIES